MQYVYVTGFSQGGTTLLMSLLDGHNRMSVYPDEPSFPRLFSRKSQYQSARHMIADWYFGTPNPLHMGREHVPGLGERHVKGDSPAVSPAAYAFISEVDLPVRSKRIRGLEQAPDFDHEQFFARYYERLEERMRAIDSVSPDEVVRGTFDALDYAKNETGHDIRLFKHPMSNVRHERLDRFRESFPDGAIIFLYRHPLARLYSFAKSRESRQTAGSGRTGYRHYIKMALKNARDYHEFRRIKKRADVLSVCYEDLVANPSGVMQRVCNHLNIPYEDICEIPTKLGRRVSVGTSRVHNGSEVSTDAIHKWRRGLSIPKIVLGALALRMPERAIESILKKPRKES